jgi:hypothetical protein
LFILIFIYSSCSNCLIVPTYTHPDTCKTVTILAVGEKRVCGHSTSLKLNSASLSRYLYDTSFKSWLLNLIFLCRCVHRVSIKNKERVTLPTRHLLLSTVRFTLLLPNKTPQILLPKYQRTSPMCHLETGWVVTLTALGTVTSTRSRLIYHECIHIRKCKM